MACIFTIQPSLRDENNFGHPLQALKNLPKLTRRVAAKNAQSKSSPFKEINMASTSTLSRRSFLSLTASASIALALPATAKKRLPIGIELYAVRDELQKDLMGTVRKVAQMGYEVVEFYSPYTQWTTDYAKDVRKLLDELKIKCLSTHNSANVFTPKSWKARPMARRLFTGCMKANCAVGNFLATKAASLSDATSKLRTPAPHSASSTHSDGFAFTA